MVIVICQGEVVDGLVEQLNGGAFAEEMLQLPWHQP